MGIFSRFLKIGEAKANKIIDSLEKPELMLEQAIRDQEKQIREARQKVQSIIATERQTKALLDKENREKQIWEDKAQSALQMNSEDLATRALVRSEEHNQKYSSLLPTWESQRSAVENLKSEIRKMEGELLALKRDKDIIIAQSKSAEVRKSIYEAKAKIGKNNTSDLIARMKVKAEKQNYEADAAKEMAELETKDKLEEEFNKLGAPVKNSIQNKLEMMKKQIT